MGHRILSPLEFLLEVGGGLIYYTHIGTQSIALGKKLASNTLLN